MADPERWASTAAGVALAVWGLTRPSVRGLAAALAGGALLERGVTGHCRIYAALGMGTTDETRSPVASVPHEQGIKVERAVTIARPAAELYRFWRDLENLPRFMEHLESVQPLGSGRSRWRARAPLGGSVEWEAEIWNERENELLAWRSLEGSEVDNAGSVQFREQPEGRGTEVRVVLEYRPPWGKVGSAVARLFGENPDQQVREDLRRFKQLMEAGEIPTTRGQPSAREGADGGRAATPPQTGHAAGAGSDFPIDPSIFAPARRGERPASRRGEDVVQESSEESFPASDPPSWTAGPDDEA